MIHSSLFLGGDVRESAHLLIVTIRFVFEQVRSRNLEVRVNTLRVLCEEFKNPTTIAGSVKAGLMR